MVRYLVILLSEALWNSDNKVHWLKLPFISFLQAYAKLNIIIIKNAFLMLEDYTKELKILKQQILNTHIKEQVPYFIYMS